MVSENASLDGLPDELMQEIVEQLNAIRSYDVRPPELTHPEDLEKDKKRQHENHIRQLALHSLCLTSHRLRRIATPMLYAYFIGTATEYGIERLRLFNERLLASTVSGDGLDKHLKYMEVRLSDYLGNESYSNRTNPPDAVVGRYFRILADFVKRITHLQHLSVASLENWEMSFWKHLMPEQNTLSPMTTTPEENLFSKLETLCLYIYIKVYDWDEDTVSFEQIGSLVATAPLLSDFRASGVMSQELDQTYELGPWKMLQRIEITECFLDLQAFANLLSACEGLKHVTCTWAFTDDVDTETPSDLYYSLSKHSQTLETLHLDLRLLMFTFEPDDIDDEESVVLEPLGTLQSFNRLKTLIISKNCLLGTITPLVELSSPPIAGLLSPSMTRFAMLVDHENSLDDSIFLWDLVAECSTSDLNLQDVRIQAEYELPKMPKITKAFTDVGVHFERMLYQRWALDPFR
jgi:hypothetical protein